LRYNRCMRLNDPANLAFWMLGSFLALVLATNIAYLAVRRKVPSRAFRAGPVAAAGWAALGLIYLLVPFLALQRGLISPYALGLTEIDWPETLSTGLVLAASAVVLTLFGWLLFRRTLPEGSRGDPLARLIAALRGPVTAVLEQWHWAFYRAAMATTLLTLAGTGLPPWLGALVEKLQADPLYWGAWLGIALAGIEWALNPFGRFALRLEGERAAAIRRASLAVATTGVFVLTRNLWLCLAMHVVVETLAATWFALPQLASQPD
jgi:hypothetical protein